MGVIITKKENIDAVDKNRGSALIKVCKKRYLEANRQNFDNAENLSVIYKWIEFAGSKPLSTIAEVDNLIIKERNCRRVKCFISESIDLIDTEFIKFTQSLQKDHLEFRTISKEFREWRLTEGLSHKKTQEILNQMKCKEFVPKFDLINGFLLSNKWHSLIDMGCLCLSVIEITSRGQAPLYIDTVDKAYARNVGRDSYYVSNKIKQNLIEHLEDSIGLQCFKEK